MAAGEVTLDQLDGPALAAWLESTGATYVEERMAAGDTRAEAESHANATFERHFPGGSPAPGQLVGRVRYGDREVGWLWVGPARSDPRSWWVWVVEIDSDLRGQGHGRRAMLLAEALARANGATTIGLNVFGSNRVARRLYTSLGYEEASIQMRKSL